MSMSARSRLTVAGAVAALLSMLPLFDVTVSNSWIVPAAIAVAAVAASGYVLRRVGAPALLVPVAQLAVLILWLGALVAGDVALLGFIPTTDWATRLVDVFRAGADIINSYAAPVPVPRGLQVILVGGAGVVALLVDVVAVALRKVALAGFPLAACYAVAASVVPEGLSWWWFVPPAAGFLTLMISEGRTRVAAWGRSASPSATHTGVPETDSLARNGRRVSAVALAAAVAVPGIAPILTEGMLEGAGGGGGGGQTIRTDNPIVDLQRNLQRSENVEVLRYRSSADDSHYIRTVTLDVFDGDEWKTGNREVPDSVDSGLPPPPGLRLSDVQVVDYTIEVTENFSSSWLPLPYPAQQIEIDGDWRYHADTLDVVSRRDDIQASRYNVRSLNVKPSVEMLRAAGGPGEDLASALELPDDLPDMVTEYATSVTAGATTDFDRAAALQEWFRSSGDFVYDIETQPGHSSTALTDFLTEKRGYCEQFAATMAIMARVLGIPARVAVGFTPGDYQGDATWLVRAHDMHAWPELYFDGIGWVSWEPTPAQRTGTPPDWTFVPTETGTTNPLPDPSRPQPQPSTSVPGISPDDGLGGGTFLPGDPSSSRWPLIALGVMAAVAFFSTPWIFARFARELRWRRAGRNAVATAEAAWSDLREAVRDAGMRWDPATTPRGIGHQVGADAALSNDDRRLLDHLVTATEQARYARAAQPVPSLRADTAILRRSILRSRSLGRRVQAFLLPSRIRDDAGEANKRMIDGFDWLDTVSERLRESFTRAAARTVGSRH